MSEMVKTLIYIGVAVVLIALAVFWKPGQAELDVNKIIGTVLFEDFTNADRATSLTITNYDNNFGKPVTFQVTRDPTTKQWIIPSEDNYPVAVPAGDSSANPLANLHGISNDDKNQMQTAATALIGLEVLGVASEVPKDHQLFGVVEPSADLAAGSKGIGMLVEIADAKKKKLVQLIIGKADAENQEQRFVRIRDEDVTYVVKVDVASFTTELSNWIEADLLKLNALDIRSVELKDYSILEVIDARTNRPIKQLMQRSDTALSWNQEESKWAIKHMLQYKEPNQPTPTELAENEELNSEQLNNLKNALDDLKIVGVKQKPAESDQDKLMEYGYYPFPTTDENNKPINDVRSANGEVHVSLQDGIKYVLRFGDIAPLDSVQSTADDSTDQIYRYLVVLAQLDPTQIPEPELIPEPETPADPKEEKKDAAPEKKDAAPEKKDAAPEKKDAAPKKKDAPQDPPKKTEPEKKPADPGACDDDEKKQATPAKTADKQADQEKKKPAAADKKPAADDKAKPAADDKKAVAEQPDDKPADKPIVPSAEELAKARELIRAENERTKNEYQEKLTAAKKRVAELNQRFANWCFIIDEKVYNQIHLSQSDVIKEKGDSDLDDFRNLDPKGLDGPGATPPEGGNPPLPNLPQQP